MVLKQGEVFISAFDGNTEQGEVELPLLPTIRITTPIFKDNQIVGLVILSINGSDKLRFLATIAENNPGLQVLNSDGYWLFRKDGKHLFDFLFEKKHFFGENQSQPWATIKHTPSGIIDNKDGLILYRKFNLQPQIDNTNPQESFLNNTVTLKTQDFPWSLLIHIPREDADSWGEEDKIQIQVLAIAVELLLIIIMLLLMRRARQYHLEKQVLLTNERALISRLVISSLMEVASESIALENMLQKGLNIILSVPWLSVERKGAIFLADNHSQKLTLATHLNLNPEILTTCREVAFGYCLCGRAAASKKIIFVPHVDGKHDMSYQGITPHGHYCVPIIAKETVMGVLNLYLAPGHVGNSEEEAFLGAAANALASIIERKQLEMIREKDILSSQLISQLETLVFQSAPLSYKTERILNMLLDHPWLDDIAGAMICIQESREGAIPAIFIKTKTPQSACPCIDKSMNHTECLDALGTNAGAELPAFPTNHSPCYFGKEHIRFGVFNCKSFQAMICLSIGHQDQGSTRQAQPLTERATQTIHTIRRILADALVQEYHNEQISKFQRAVEQSTASVIITDSLGHIEYVNKKFVTVSGYTMEEVMGHSPNMLKSGLTPPSVYQEMWQNLLSGQPWNGELCNRRKDGTLYWESALISPVINQEGKTTHLIAIKEDITDKRSAQEERQQLEKQLRQSQKMEALGHLTGGIAHDFNNILAAIKGFSELALVRFAQDEKSKLHLYLTNILVASDRARDLIAQMMSFSRTRETEVKRVILPSLIKEVVKLVRATLPASISITATMASPDIAINADPVQLHQTMMNLFVNARDALDGKGRVDVRVARETHGETLKCSSCHSPFFSGELVVLSVKDDGPGVPLPLQEKIFQPFFTTKEVGQGTGMGLSVIHGIVHALNGHIVLRSNPGQGTEFHLYFQPCENQSLQTASVAPAPKKLDDTLRGTVLVVDDELAILGFLKDVLEEEGLSVITNSSSVEALSWFEVDPNRVDLVITDQTMPNMTGTELIKKMKSHRPNLPVILCTGFSRDVNAENAASLGVDYFLVKPMELSELLKTLKKILGGAAPSLDEE